MLNSIKAKQQQAAELTEQLGKSLLIKHLFPNISFPVTLHQRGKWIERMSQGVFKAHLLDSTGTEYPLDYGQWLKLTDSNHHYHQQKEWSHE